MNLTHNQILTAFNNCRQIYGSRDIHVNLIAKQLGTLATDVVTYINANPTLFSTRMIPSNTTISNPLGNDYPGMLILSITSIPLLSYTTQIREGDSGGTITLTISGDTFKDDTNTSNWTIDAGNTGLTISSVANGTVTSHTTPTKTLTFTGTAFPSTISIQCKAAGMTGGVASETIYIDIPAISFDYSTIQDIEAEIDILSAEVFPEITIVDMGTDGDYTILDSDVHVVTETTNVDEADSFELPASTGDGRRIILSNQDATSGCVATANGTDTINGDATITIPKLSSITLIDWAEGKWLAI